MCYWFKLLVRNFLKVFAFTAFSLLVSSPVFAQVDTAWVRRYVGSGMYGIGQALALDHMGNVYVAGSTWSSSPEDFAILKYNANGDTVWTRSYDGPAASGDGAIAIAVDSRGFVYVTGYSEGIGSGMDYATIKYDSLGNQRWVARYDGPSHLQDGPYALVVDGQGNVYVTGWCGTPGNSEDYATVKYDSLGNQVWARTYNGPRNGEDGAGALCVDAQRNVYVTGYSQGLGTSGDITTIKYNSIGDSLWVRRYNGPANGEDGGIAIAADSSGNVYVGGWSAGRRRDYTTIKYDSLGDTLWVRRYDGPVHLDDSEYDLVLDRAGNVYVTGYSFGTGDSADFCTIKYDNAGNQRWVSRYDGPAQNWDVADCIALDGQGNVYVAGRSTGLTDIHGDYCTVKYDSLGNQLWVARYNGPADNYDEIFGLAVDDSDNVYVTGTSDGNVSPVMCTIKYRQFVGVEDRAPTVPVSPRFELGQNIPNPSVSGTMISYTLPCESQVVLRVYNSAGQLVRSLADGQELAGSKQVIWNGQDEAGRRVPSGVYFYCLQAGSFSDTKKMVLIR